MKSDKTIKNSFEEQFFAKQVELCRWVAEHINEHGARRKFLTFPVEVRNVILVEQAEAMRGHYNSLIRDGEIF